MLNKVKYLRDKEYIWKWKVFLWIAMTNLILVNTYVPGTEISYMGGTSREVEIELD